MRTIKNNPNLILISREEYQKVIDEAYSKGKKEGAEKVKNEVNQTERRKAKAKIKVENKEVDFRATVTDSEVGNDKSNSTVD